MTGRRPYIYVNMFFILFLCVGPAAHCDGKLEWDLETKTVVFGKEIVLSCKQIGTVCTQTRKWLGGKDYTVLCYNGLSTNPSKYKMMSNEQNNTFYLMIKQLAYEDTGCDYTCACGFSQYTQKLLLQNLNFTYPPNIQIEDTSVLEAEILYMNLTIKRVHPIPKCIIIYINKGDEKTENITKLDIELLPDKIMYQATMRMSINTNCQDVIKVSCQVGSDTYEIKSWKTNRLCSDQVIENELILLILLPVLMAIFGIIVILLYCKHKMEAARLRHRRQEDVLLRDRITE